MNEELIEIDIKSQEELPFCLCGCGGRVTKPGNKYIHNHNWTGVDSTYRDEQSRKRIQYFKDHPEKLDEHSSLMIQLHTDHPEWAEQQSVRVKERFKDPEERKLAAEKERQRYIDHPELREELSKIKFQLYKDHPEIIELMSKSTIQFYIDHPPKHVKLQEKKLLNNGVVKKRVIKCQKLRFNFL